MSAPGNTGENFMRVIAVTLRSSAALLIAAVATVAGFATPAEAIMYRSAAPKHWTHTDAAHPTTPVIDPAGDTPLGASRRAYFTFDLAPFRKQVVHSATLSSQERSVADCGTSAPIEFWRTRQVTERATWEHPPGDLELVAEKKLGKGAICPGGFLSADVLTQVTAAMTRRENTITFAVRVAAPAESDPHSGRTMAPFRLALEVNRPPTVSGLRLDYPEAPCGTPARHPVAGHYRYFMATAADQDPSDKFPTLDFAIWPVEHPEQRTEFGGSSSGRAGTDLSGYPDGTVLAWSARAHDNDDYGPWGRGCYLTVDNTAPTSTPAITARTYVEAGYPGSGGPGIAGAFILDARGDRDVVAFHYAVGGTIGTTVKAHHPGGKVRISYTPRIPGNDALNVWPVDAAGNFGLMRSYKFYVRDSAPWFEVDVAGVGLPSRITFYSQVAEATSFGYAIDGGPETRVPAVNRSGSGEVMFATAGGPTITVNTYVGKKLAGTVSRAIQVDDAPRVTSAEFLPPAQPIAGVAGTFTVAPRSTGVVAYLYDIGAGEQRAEAGPDGAAHVRWTAETGGFHQLTVRSVTAAGVTSVPKTIGFDVIDPRPEVWFDNADGVGRPVNVWMFSDVPGATGFEWSFDGGPAQSTDGGGYTYVTVTPAHAGENTFTARARRADGTLLPPTTVVIPVTSGPVVTSAGPYDTNLVLGREATLTIKPALPDVVSYRWHLDDEQDGRTIEATADGSATVTLIPERSGYDAFNVVSIGRDGTESDLRRFSLPLRDPTVEYWGTWNDWYPEGGVGQPGWLGFSGSLTDVTVKYLWHVDDGPVHEVAQAEDDLVTSVTFTPVRAGANTLYVQRVFRDGAVSPMREYTLLVAS